MSKNKTLAKEFPSYEGGWIVQDRAIQHLEGRLLTLVESIGLREGQEKAVKDLVRSEVWKLVEPGFWISGDDNSELHHKYSNHAMLGSVGGDTHNPIPSH